MTTPFQLSCGLFLVQILTKDSVTVAVDAVVYFRVSNATVSVTNVEDAHHRHALCKCCALLHDALQHTAAGANNTAQHSWHENARGDSCRPRAHRVDDAGAMKRYIANERNELQQSLDEATDHWGVKVERVEVKDVRLPQQLQRAMAAEAEAAREARAKVLFL